MFAFLQGLGVVLLGVILGLITFFVVSPEPAKAPIAESPVATTTEEVATVTLELEGEPKEVQQTAFATSTTPVPQSETSTSLSAKPTPAEQKPQAPILSPSSVNELVRAAVVNVLCTATPGSGLNSITASGVVVDPRGVILTNSHVAQYLLLKDYPTAKSVECVIRTGNPAQPKYRAELLFMPPSWVQENAEKIVQESPMGNGDHDYALLYIPGTVNANSEMPSSFPSLTISTESPTVGQDTLIAAYPAGFLGGAIIQKELYQASSVVQVVDLFTFKEDTLDLFSIGGSIVAQQGSSGGAIGNMDGALVGLIVTSTDAPDTASRDLRALSMPYLLRDFQNEAGTSLTAYLTGNIKDTALNFQQTKVPGLKTLLVNAIERR